MTRAAAGYLRGVLSDELFVLWSAARAEANMAYDAWCEEPGRMTYAVYRAAEDRCRRGRGRAQRERLAGARRRLTIQP